MPRLYPYLFSILLSGAIAATWGLVLPAPWRYATVLAGIFLLILGLKISFDPAPVGMGLSHSAVRFFTLGSLSAARSAGLSFCKTVALVAP
jgi:hypothetical protein